MSDEKQQEHDSTESLIESLHVSRKKRLLLINPDYLDDEKLPEDERTAVLKEIFNKNIREKQLSRIISHLTPVLDGAHPPSALVYGPTGSGKTVSYIHVLSTFGKVAERHGISFHYRYIDLTSPKTYFGALNEVAIALDSSNRKYRKGIPVEFMQSKITNAIAAYNGFLCLLIDEADNIRPNPDAFLTFLAKTLPRKVSCRLILILITNRLDWEKTLDPRILSFLKKTDIIFEPYDALDLLEILKLRAKKALCKDKVDQAALKKMAAYASRETGDARKAVELLTKAVRVAEETTGHLGEEEVDIAEHRLEVDKSTELINALATQQRLALQSCYVLFKKGMYDLRDYKPPEKIYGNVKAGWNRAKIYQGGLKNGRSKRGYQYQYFLIDFEILEEGVLVPFFSFYNKEKVKPDPLLGKLLMIAGLVGRNFKGDQAGFFKAIIGVELMVKVAHTYKKSGKNRIRRDKIVDFRPLEDAIVYEELEPDNESIESDVQGDVRLDFQNKFESPDSDSDDKIPF